MSHYDEKKSSISPNKAIGKIFIDPKSGKKCNGFYVIPSKKCNGVIKSGKKHKVIMIVGETGSGKSTILNSMTNYIYGVKYNDNFRYKLIGERTKKVTSYELTHKNSILQYKLTVIDTPGFDDYTKGAPGDIEIMKDIKFWFDKKIDTLDAICFVVKSCTRLTRPQKYIFSSILNLFGKGIKKHIYILVTFADKSKPPVLAGLNKERIEYQKYFKFNNSSFITDPLINKLIDPADVLFDKLFWNMGIESFKLFFDDLKNTTPVSLKTVGLSHLNLYCK